MRKATINFAVDIALNTKNPKISDRIQFPWGAQSRSSTISL